MKTLVVLVGFLLLTAAAVTPPAALAADPATPTRSGSADENLPQTQAEVNTPAIPENQAEIEAGVVPEGGAPAVEKSAAPVLSPLMLEIQAALAAEQARVADLEARFAAAADEASALAIQKEIEQIKVETELSILRLQAEHARQEGRVEQAAQIEAAIAEMMNPRPAGIPIERPAPTQGSDQR
jgi:hypothetical protein